MFIAIDETIGKGFGESWYYYLFAILSLVMYLRRRKIRLSEK